MAWTIKDSQAMQDLYVNDGCSTKIPPGSSNFFVQYHHKRSRVQAHQPAVLVPSVSVQSHIGGPGLPAQPERADCWTRGCGCESCWLWWSSDLPLNWCQQWYERSTWSRAWFFLTVFLFLQKLQNTKVVQRRPPTTTQVFTTKQTCKFPFYPLGDHGKI